MTIALAAAGTGGHVYPALAVADALGELEVSRNDILFVGGDRMEARTVPAAGYHFYGVQIRGLRRSLSAENLALPAVVWRAASRLHGAFRQQGVSVVCVFGGYVSVPAAWAAHRAGAAIFLQEQNAVPGLANRLVSRRALASFVAFPAAESALPRARLVGNPLRRQLADFDRAALRREARHRYGLGGDATVVGILGGSLGAAVLNRAAGEIVRSLGDRHDVAILHLTGSRHLQDVQRESGASPVTWRTVGFEDEMEYFYAAVDLVVSRAGALTISELAATGTAAIVVPYAAGTAGHQAANAAHLASVGGVNIVAEDDVARLPSLVVELVDDRARRSAMAASAAAEGMPEAARTVAQTLAEVHRA